MDLLIINTLEEHNPIVQEITDYLIEKASAYRILHTESMKIAPCIGCNACWLKTPGICSLKLGLKVNTEKTRITRPQKLKYLGFGFYKDSKAKE